MHTILKDAPDARAKAKSYFVQMSKSDKEDRSKNKQHGAENTMFKLCTGGPRWSTLNAVWGDMINFQRK